MTKVVLHLTSRITLWTSCPEYLEIKKITHTFSSHKIIFISQKYKQGNNKTAYVVQKNILYTFTVDAFVFTFLSLTGNSSPSYQYIWIWHHACNIIKKAKGKYIFFSPRTCPAWSIYSLHPARNRWFLIDRLVPFGSGFWNRESWGWISLKRDLMVSVERRPITHH